MKIDIKTYKDREKRQIGMTAGHTSQLDKVLFLASAHFSFYQRTLHTLASRTSQHKNQNLPKSATLPPLINTSCYNFLELYKSLNHCNHV